VVLKLGDNFRSSREQETREQGGGSDSRDRLEAPSRMRSKGFSVLLKETREDRRG
jgi:hypothetical protein